MTRRWFGTDGVRGEAHRGPLAAPFLRRLGRALAEQALADGHADADADEPGAEGDHGGPNTRRAADVDGVRPLVLLARDTRESGPELCAALAEGLAAGGARVVDLGVVPTPALPMAMRARRASRGLVVSASHNPWTDNGVKVFGRGGRKLSDDQERALEARIAELGGEDDDATARQAPAPDSSARGTRLSPSGSPARGTGGGIPSAGVQVVDGAAAYVEAVLERFAGLDLGGMRLAVDCAHGAACLTAPAVLAALGASVTPFFDAPDGRNINAQCGSTHMQPLRDAVRAGHFDLGIAFDGDADRVLMVDATGRECSGDHMLGFLGPWLASRDELPGRTVVATVMSNLGLERTLRAAGIRLLRTDVGDRYVHAAMREGGFGLGGEASGHLLFGAEHHFNGDGLYSALRVLGGLRDTGRDLGSVIDGTPVIPQVLRNVRVASKPPLDTLPALRAQVTAAEARFGDDIRILLRYSGTENLARVMVEGVDSEVVHALADELAALWLSLVAGPTADSPRS